VLVLCANALWGNRRNSDAVSQLFVLKELPLTKGWLSNDLEPGYQLFNA